VADHVHAGTLSRPISEEFAMKTDIHPAYAEVTVKCSCGNTFTTRSTKPGEQHIELCNECHPFYTGKQKLVDSGGRVERFNKRYGRRDKK
jgi:large subunit ribosomal protein L31